ncbi:MAG TPA: hypothetical protein VK212_01450 [Lentimicrobium sp.]|nr:hypothetical protein [Lentimicrobium sp.]
MPFVDEILKYKSLSIVGLEKNTGKTECLNYILKRLEGSGCQLALTSIGVDGEQTDIVTGTAKPETDLYESLIFITSEKHYRQKRLEAEILDISSRRTALGRLVTARALSRGKVIFSGPADTLWIKELIGKMEEYKVQTTIIDGAISRLSHGSPAITESMILTTGAAVSATVSNLISHTKFVYELIGLKAYESPAILKDKLLSLNTGLYAINHHNDVIDLEIPSVFLLKENPDKLFRNGNTLFAGGAVTDKMLDFIRLQKEFKNTILIVRDFTRLFIKPDSYRAFINSGHKLKVLLNSKLIAICVNPVSPSGYVLNSAEVCAGMSEALQIPVYDIKRQ